MYPVKTLMGMICFFLLVGAISSCAIFPSSVGPGASVMLLIGSVVFGWLSRKINF